MKVSVDFDVTEREALYILCKTLYMDFALDEDTDFYVKKNANDELGVYVKSKNGFEELYDERGELFVALRNVIVNIVPNVGFRNASYIQKKGGVK